MRDHAARLLAAARPLPLGDAPALVLAAAAGELELAEQSAGLRAAAACNEPDLAFYLTAAAGAVASRDEARAQLQSLAPRLPRGSMQDTLYRAEPLLARLGAAWAWEFVLALLGPFEAAASPLGLFFAREEERVSPSLTASNRAVPFARMLAADRCARAAVRGELTSLDDPRLQPLVADPRSGQLFSTEASSMLVAAAWVDLSRGLEIADVLCESGTPTVESLIEVARLVVAAGRGNELASRARGYVDWTVAAAVTRALPPDEIAAIVAELVPRIVEDAWPGTEHEAGLPLAGALAAAGRSDAAAALARTANAAPLAVAQLLLALDCTAAMDALSRDETFVAWARETPSDVDAIDAAIVVAASPWEVVPGSLLDELGLISERRRAVPARGPL